MTVNALIQTATAHQTDERTSYGSSSPLICPYLYCFFHRYHKYFAIARISRMGKFLDHVDNITSHLIMDNNF